MYVRALFLAACAALSLATSARADLIGRASVIDGDTLEIHGQRIRLHGIDSPEKGQRCYRDGKEWRCGRDGAMALDKFINARTVACETRDIDRYKRVVAVCKIGRTDLNRWMVRNGWAVAYRRYSTDYVAVEEQARAAKRGIWAGNFVMPWDWRRGERGNFGS